MDGSELLRIAGLGAILLAALWVSGLFGAVALFRRPRHELKGKRAQVVSWAGEEGMVLIEGERWKARAVSGDCAHAEEVMVHGREGLVALVRPARGSRRLPWAGAKLR